MKKLFGFLLMAVASICFVTVVSAASQTITLTTSNQARVTANGLGSTYYTEIYAPAIKNQPTVRTAVQRQMLGIWGFSAVADANFKTPGVIVFEWGGIGTLNTRATWTTNTPGGEVTNGTFSLWD